VVTEDVWVEDVWVEDVWVDGVWVDGVWVMDASCGKALEKEETTVVCYQGWGESGLSQIACHHVDTVSAP
jgi:hypothetical protein